MGLKVGIIGLPNVGKSTLFNALTLNHVEAANYPFATISPNTGIVSVPDSRVKFLSSLFKPEKTIYAACEFVDIAGLVRGASKGEGLGNQFLAHIRECDALIEVVRCFENSEIVHVENNVDPKRDIETINLELIFADLETLNKRRDKIAPKARVNKEKLAMFELNILDKMISFLEAGNPVRAMKNLTKEEYDYSRKNYFLLTQKPLIYLANISEEDIENPTNSTYFQIVQEIARKENTEVIPISVEIESEIATLSEDDKKSYEEILGIKEEMLPKVIKSALNLLGLATFFTVGKDEVRAWTFKKGMTASECAGLIHTDLQRGFIRAEIYTYEDIFTFTSESAIKEAGKLRIEGKDYLMKDGDIVLLDSMCNYENWF